MTEEEAKKEFKKQQEIPGTPAHWIKTLTATAHPAMVELIENQAILALRAGHNFAQKLKEADSDPEEKRKVMAEFQRIATRVGKAGSLDITNFVSDTKVKEG